MDKSPDAFRTISEVAEVLQTPAHVLRFWESRFPQIRPVKRAGGRRYYRPADVALLLGIKHLLHNEGMTIRGVQKILREQGVRHVAGLSGQEIADDAGSAEAELEAALAANFGGAAEAAPLPQELVETAQIVALETALRARAEAAALSQPEEPQPVDVPPVDAQPIEAQPEAAGAEETELPNPDQPALPGFEPEPVVLVDLPPEPAADALPESGSAPAPDSQVEPLPESQPETGAAPAADSDPQAETPPDFAPLPADAPLLDRLRALPAHSLATPEARALRDRLASLAARLSAPPPAAPF